MFFAVKAASYGADGAAVQEIGYTAYVPYLLLLIVITALNLLSIFTSKILVFQLRTTVLAALVTLALQLWLAVDFIGTHQAVVFRFSAIFPLISVILDVLAARGILSDQLIVESASHLRRSRAERRKK